MKVTVPLCVALLLSLSAASVRADVAGDLKGAAAAARPVFLVVTEGEARGTDLALRVCAEAAKILPEAVVARLDRADPANSAITKRYRLESVEVPLILVIASNGVAAAATKPAAVTANRLVRMVPSPAKAAQLKAVEEGKATFLVFTGERTPGRLGAIGACDEAIKLLGGKGATVVVDLADPIEAGFVLAMKVDAATKVAVTVVMNARGQQTAKFDAVPEPAALVDAAKKVAQECCPGGNCK